MMNSLFGSSKKRTATTSPPTKAAKSASKKDHEMVDDDPDDPQKKRDTRRSPTTSFMKKLSTLPWACTQCTYRNSGTARECKMCKSARPAPADLKFEIQIKRTDSSLNKKLIIDEGMKQTVTLGFLKDILEARSGIAFDKQHITVGPSNTILTGNSEDHLTELMFINPTEHIKLTIQHSDEIPSKGKKSTSEQKQATGTPSLDRTVSDDLFANDDGDEGDWGAAGADDENLDLDGDDWGDTDEKKDDVDTDNGDHVMSSTPVARRSPVATDDMDDLDMGSAVTSTPTHTSTSTSTASTLNYTLMKPAQLESRMIRALTELQDVTSLGIQQVAILCRAYRWNQRELQDAYFADADKVRRTVGLAPDADTDIDVRKRQAELKTSDCGLCGDDEPEMPKFALECDHIHCEDCWKNWLTAEFDKGPTCIKTMCPGLKCPFVVPSHVQGYFLGLSAFDKKQKLETWILQNFVECTKSIKWCPAAGCTYSAERKDEAAVGGVQCGCGHGWCFDCTKDDHQPASCEEAESWNVKNSSDAENVNWILANTKICPKCQVHIEKNQGCNHMTCRKCGHEFCWLCKGNWKTHSSCSKYDPSSSDAKLTASHMTDEEKKAEQAKNDLQRYMHYFTRFDNHAKSIKFAEKTRLQTAAKCEQLQALKGSGIQYVQFLTDAVDTVIRNRRVLQWTYVYGFYMKAQEKSSRRLLYENSVAKLEELTEKLHGLTEKPLETLTDNATRTNVINLTRTAQKYLVNMIRAAKEDRD